MKGLLELILTLFALWEAACLFMLVTLFIGLLDQMVPIEINWKNVFGLIRYSMIGLIISEGIVIGIQFALGETLINNLMFSWALRIVAAASFLRVLFPAKHWWLDTKPAPHYPRLKLFIYSMAALGLSFIPVLLNLR